MAADEIRGILPQGFHIRVQAPMALNDYNEPEPDIVVVPGTYRDYMPDHPSTAALVIEVSDTTLRFDLNKKAPIYARAQVPDYWVINLKDRLLHVHRDPTEDPSSASGYSYSKVIRLTASDIVSPLFAPAASIPVADLLP
jgi:Uma2 family endonuclease